ncbi:aminomethyl-transferring glycine dehydrogenase [Moritella sp. 28]|uniref:aminomethyl-transferring glycine dehydrogenase n=1 Tax=Moritella sp. 28 TaxID=2746232 RepID=UPI001BAB9581|nr:aminomethyl-transferring glycine dehydrogenase [Moritella sp. 28]QUM86328.1 aminomethyl-transferring glycine dehydrogenase [Moritella sp. 28]
MKTHTPLAQLEQIDNFARRHIGPCETETKEMLAKVGADSLEDLIQQTVPSSILLAEDIVAGHQLSEVAALQELKAIAAKNTVNKSYIGMGYYGTNVPNVILRNVFENPGWYTAYTPYQPEIAQGRLEALLNFQTMTCDLTGMDLASASLLDEATAAAEAMAMCKRVSKNKKCDNFFIADSVHPQVADVMIERAEHFGFTVIQGPAETAPEHDLFGAVLQYPGTDGDVTDISDIIAAIQAKKGVVAVGSDLLALTRIKSPAELGADMAFGSSQRFGVPMGYGGPHAAFFASCDKHKRSMPGRIIGVSKDTHGKPALRMAMQTREQHIRREKANSNICTAQVLLANMAGFYATYHGPEGLKDIAKRVHRFTDLLAAGLVKGGLSLTNNTWFDTITVQLDNDQLDNKEKVVTRALAAGINFRLDAEHQVGISLDETITQADLATLFDVLLGDDHGISVDALEAELAATGSTSIPAELERESAFLTHPVFNTHHSETEMLRYIKSLENKDLALNHSMISLGSCTMKLNAVAEMIPVTWPEFSNMHPFCPADQAVGYKVMIDLLEDWLVSITGYDSICMQPNSGAQGEYAGLLAIHKYHESRGESHRNICLIPSSAHGTNPASAQMAGLKVVVTKCDVNGNVDVADLREKAEELKDNLSCIMITYPSTHGVYEETIKEICGIIHDNGGQVYMDGANMNAQVALTSPGSMGSDVSHLNLHKTFAIPHGGGGPGMGPIGVKAHLAPFVAGHAVADTGKESRNNGAVSAAQFGSASILPITWMYINMLGTAGLKRSTQTAILNANYLAQNLDPLFPVLYKGRNDRVAHECIVDLRPLKETTGITESDVAKRLMDYGFHSPTMSFPVAGTLMIEPTESESKAELDRFIEAMTSIRAEIAKVESGEWTAEQSPLHHAPHTLADIVDANWDRAYDRETAVYPAPYVKKDKFWPTVNRIDDVYGDRNLFCSCPPVESYND